MILGHQTGNLVSMSNDPSGLEQLKPAVRAAADTEHEDPPLRIARQERTGQRIPEWVVAREDDS
jgi:hypothetical protein